MTVDELASRISLEELNEWGAVFRERAKKTGSGGSSTGKRRSRTIGKKGLNK